MYKGEEVFGHESIEGRFNNYFVSVFAQDKSEVVIPLNESPEKYLEVKNVFFSVTKRLWERKSKTET